MKFIWNEWLVVLCLGLDREIADHEARTDEDQGHGIREVEAGEDQDPGMEEENQDQDQVQEGNQETKRKAD